MDSLPNTVTRGKPLACSWDLLWHRALRCRLGHGKRGCWNLNLTSWKGARGDGEAEAQSSAGGLGQVRPQVGAMEIETWDSEAQLLCGVCYCLPSPSCRATVTRKDVLNWTEIQIDLVSLFFCFVFFPTLFGITLRLVIIASLQNYFHCSWAF